MIRWIHSLVALVLLSCASPARAQGYIVEEMPALVLSGVEGSGESSARAINTRGWVAGHTAGEPVLWQGGSALVRPLSPASPARIDYLRAFPTGIADDGTLVGYYSRRTFYGVTSFLAAPGRTAIVYPPGTEFLAISPEGLVGGSYRRRPGIWALPRACLRLPDTPVEGSVGLFPWFDLSEHLYTLDRTLLRTVAGISGPSSADERHVVRVTGESDQGGYLYRHLPGGQGSTVFQEGFTPTGVSDRGMVSGNAGGPALWETAPPGDRAPRLHLLPPLPGYRHAWTLGVHPRAGHGGGYPLIIAVGYARNNLSEPQRAIGWTMTPTNPPHFTVLDLTSRVTRPDGWVLTSAEGINAAGQIAGSGLHRGLRRGYRLTLTAATTRYRP